MTAFILRRLMQSVGVVAIMSLIVFFGVHIVGDPVYLLINPQANQADIEAAIRALGLDRPIWEQYWHFVTGALQGDLGRSFVFGEPALRIILQRMPATLELAVAALACASDYFAYCSKYPTGSSKVRQCMSANGHKLSSSCVNALIAAGEVSRTEVARRAARAN